MSVLPLFLTGLGYGEKTFKDRLIRDLILIGIGVPLCVVTSVHY